MGEDLLKIAKEQEEDYLFWEAAETYKKALLEFNKLKGHTKEKSFCKQKIRETNIKKSDDFKSHMITYDFSENQKIEIEKFIKYIVDADNSFYLIGHHPFLFPSFLEVKKRAEKSLPFSYKFANLSTEGKDGNIIKGGHDPEISWFHQQYAISQGIILQIYLVPIFRALLLNGKLNSYSLIAYFKEKSIFTDDFIYILEVSIEKFLNADHISCLHILVPKLEKVIMDLTPFLSNNQVDVISSRKQKGQDEKIWTQDKTLGEDLLRDNEMISIWGKDLCEQIIFVFFSQLGRKLRHKIAHGYSTLDDLSFENCTLVLYFYIVIISRIKTIIN